MDCWRSAAVEWNTGRFSVCDALLRESLHALPLEADNTSLALHSLLVRCNLLLCRMQTMLNGEAFEYLENLIAICDQYLVSNTFKKSAEAMHPFIDVQFNIALLLLTKVGRPEQCCEFLERMSVSWKLPVPGMRSTVAAFLSLADTQTRYILSSPSVFRALLLYALALLASNRLRDSRKLLQILNWSLDRIDMGSETGIKDMRSSIAAFLSLSLLLLSRSEPPQQREVLLAQSHAAIADADKNPQALSHIFLKGCVLLELKSWREAALVLRNCSDPSFSHSSQVHLYLGSALCELGDWRASLPHLQRCLPNARTHVVAALHIARALHELSEYSAAEIVLKTLLDELLKRQPEQRHGVLVADVASNLARLQNSEQALQTLEHTIRITTEEGSRLSIACVRLHVSLLLDHRSPDIALAAFERYKETFGDDCELQALHCEALFRRASFKECIVASDALICNITAIEDSGSVEPSPAKKQRTGVGRVVPGVPSTLLEPVCPPSVVAESNRHLQDGERSSHLKARVFNNKAIALECVGHRSYALSMLTLALDANPAFDDAMFNLCLLLWDDNRQVQASVTWMRYRGIELRLPIESYKEMLEECSVVDLGKGHEPDSSSPKDIVWDGGSSTCGSVSELQMRALDGAVLRHWMQQLADEKLQKMLQEEMQLQRKLGEIVPMMDADSTLHS